MRNENISKIHLVDLLVFGLPDVKNEIINGRVFSQIEFDDSVEAATACEELRKEAAGFLNPNVA